MQLFINHFQSISSTNDLAISMANNGAPEGTVVVAREQTAGRGRRGKSWTSPPGSGLYLSIVLRPDRPASELWQLAFVVSAASAEAISQISDLQASIKWPNDILLNEKKICGILIEARSGKHNQQMHKAVNPPVIAGIGINVNTELFPQEIASKATSIYLETGRKSELEKVEHILLDAVQSRYSEYLCEGFTSILKLWKSMDCTSGRRLTVLTPEGHVEGRAIDVDAGGDLIIEKADGTTLSVTTGEVFFNR